MQSQEVKIKPIVKVVLKSDAEVLDEVVVTGYGVTRKAAFTGAATVVGTDKISSKNDANPIKALEGTVPGLQMNIGSGQPGAPATIFVRGRNSLNSGTQPLYVVDGVQYFADAVGVRSDEGQEISPLASLNANDIESITVLKDATATSIYGARAANGVIVITTKKGKSGKPQVNFTAKVGFETMPSFPDSYKRTNAAQHMELAPTTGYQRRRHNIQQDYLGNRQALQRVREGRCPHCGELRARPLPEPLRPGNNEPSTLATGGLQSPPHNQ